MVSRSFCWPFLPLLAAGSQLWESTQEAAVLGGVILVVTAAFNLIFGIMAVKYCDNAGKAKALRVMGVVLLVLAAASLIIYISGGLTVVIGCLVDLMISIIYFWGAQKNVQSL